MSTNLSLITARPLPEIILVFISLRVPQRVIGYDIVLEGESQGRHFAPVYDILLAGKAKAGISYQFV